MMQFNCKECEKSFDSQRSLHAHIKIHKMLLGGYYIKHFQRKSLMSGELLPFKDVKSYFAKDFRNPEEMDEYLSSCSQEVAQNYIKTQFKKWGKKMGTVDAPCFNELETSPWMPKVHHCIKAFGSYGKCAQHCGMQLSFKKPLPKDFWSLDISTPKFLCDTREQQPFKFKNKTTAKVDVGDYTLLGDNYNYTYVDRKALGDFIGTMSGENYKRFCKEMDRARALSVKLFVVVEASPDDVRKRSKKFLKRANPDYIFGNMRRMQRDYADVCRFVFAKDRAMAQELTARILVSGKDCWDCDIQYFLENK